MGNITLYASDSTLVIGKGSVRCNKGTLTSDPVVVSDGICRYTVSNSINFTLTADNRFDLVTTQSRKDSMSEPGIHCTQPSSCTIAYKVLHLR